MYIIMAYDPPQPSAPLLVALDPANNRLPRCILIVLQIASIPTFRAGWSPMVRDQGNHQPQQLTGCITASLMLPSALHQLHVPLLTPCCNASHNTSLCQPDRLTGWQGEMKPVHYASFPPLHVTSPLQVSPRLSAHLTTSGLATLPVASPLHESAT